MPFRNRFPTFNSWPFYWIVHVWNVFLLILNIEKIACFIIIKYDLFKFSFLFIQQIKLIKHSECNCCFLIRKKLFNGISPWETWKSIYNLCNFFSNCMPLKMNEKLIIYVHVHIYCAQTIFMLKKPLYQQLLSFQPPFCKIYTTTLLN